MAEGAVNTLRGKFGRTAVETGYTFRKGRNAHPRGDRRLALSSYSANRSGLSPLLPVFGSTSVTVSRMPLRWSSRRQLRVAVAIDLLRPMDAEIDRIARTAAVSCAGGPHISAVYFEPLDFRSALMARVTTTSPRQLPSSDNEVAVASVKLQGIVGASAVIFTVPLPAKLPLTSWKIGVVGMSASAAIRQPRMNQR
jgi:hypothetical protein